MSIDKPDITDHLLTQLAGQGAFERGETVLNNGAVENLVMRDDKVTARQQKKKSTITLHSKTKTF